MKNLFNIIVCFLLASGTQQVKAQKEVSVTEPHYTLTVYASLSKSETSFDEKHPLCSSLNSSWNMFQVNYRRVSKVSTGFSGQTVEIYKPAIYNAVVKADKYIRKAVSKGEIKNDEAVAMLKHILDCANALAMERDTKTFEKDIAGAKTPDTIIRIFNNVELQYV